jgi:hypothetical protein
MQPELKRKIGEIPAWAMKGPIDLKNFALRAEWYGYRVMQWGSDWPFLSSDPDMPGTADVRAWSRYFTAHLGGYPPVFELFRNGTIRFFNVPDMKPEDFDASYAGAPDQPAVISVDSVDSR